MMIGDSFTEGIGVSYPQTFSGIIGAALRPAHVEVIDAGVVSYSPRLCFYKAKWLIEERHLEMDEIYLFVDISDPQDELIYSGFSPEMDTGGRPLMDAPMHTEIQPVHLYEYSLIYNAVRTGLLHRSSAFIKPTRLLDEQGRCIIENVYASRGQWPYRDEIYRDWGAKGLERCSFFVQRLASLATLHHIRLTVCIYPWPEELRTGNVASRNRTYWKLECERMKLDFIDFYDDFLTAGSAEKVIRQYYIDGDVHWNEEGHRLVADGWLARYRAR